ncbi:MAG: hypothetical protein ABI761_06615 [Saprospiraceae bacterium]
MINRYKHSATLTKILFIYLSGFSFLCGQNQNEILQIIQLDSITIEANKEDTIDLKGFISMMMNDETFYKGFKNLRKVSYSFQNQISIFNKNKMEIAGYSSSAFQHYSPPCRSMTITDQRNTGDFFDSDGNYRWYTARLYDRLFFTHGSVCIDSITNAKPEMNRMEKNIEELKRLLFSPGSRTHVPLLGDKTAIFDQEMLPFYDYRFQLDTLNGIECYLFEVEVKPEFKMKHENKTVIKKLSTWFEKNDHQIMRRDYQLAGNTMAYSFDVLMKVDLIHIKDRYLPKNISYEGTWKIFTKKRESAKFTIVFSDFKF